MEQTTRRRMWWMRTLALATAVGTVGAFGTASIPAFADRSPDEIGHLLMPTQPVSPGGVVNVSGTRCIYEGMPGRVTVTTDPADGDFSVQPLNPEGIWGASLVVANHAAEGLHTVTATCSFDDEEEESFTYPPGTYYVTKPGVTRAVSVDMTEARPNTRIAVSGSGCTVSGDPGLVRVLNPFVNPGDDPERAVPNIRANADGTWATTVSVGPVPHGIYSVAAICSPWLNPSEHTIAYIPALVTVFAEQAVSTPAPAKPAAPVNAKPRFTG
jgi:hypothetical protein